MGRKVTKVFPTPVATRLPRKTVRRLYREVAAAVIVVVLLAVLIRTHHSYGGRMTWKEDILPKYSVDGLEKVPRNVYYMKTERVLYCYIPKNACSRFKPLLRKREGFADWDDNRMLHGKKNGLQRLMRLEKERGIKMLKEGAGWKKFVVVRNPFSRLISAYQNKVANPWPDQRDDFWNKHLYNECPSMVEGMGMPIEGPLMTLEEFLKCLLAKDSKQESNEHWRPQTDLCGLDHIKYDRYLHVENLLDDVTELLGYLGWAEENVRNFRMVRNPVYSRRLENYFSGEALTLALEYYRNDFEVLGYPKVPKGQIDFYSVFDGTNFQPGFVPPVDFQSHPLPDNNLTTH